VVRDSGFGIRDSGAVIREHGTGTQRTRLESIAIICHLWYYKVKPHPFVVANRMVRGSYVSCQSALAHYGLIPEHVPVVTSITTARPG